MKEFDVVVVGGGISGLSFAHYCADAGLKTLLIEKNKQVGGTWDSHVFEGNAKGYWLELGAHTCYNSYGNLLGVMEDIGILDKAMAFEKAPYKMLIDNQLKSIASELSIPALIPALWRMPALKKEGRTVESYYSRLVGKKNYDRVIRHVFAAVLSQPADDFPADAVFRKRERRKDVIRKFTFDGGLQKIAEAIAEESDFKTLLGAPVQSIETDGPGFSVKTDQGVFKARRLAVATSSSAAARLLRGVFPEVAAKLDEIRTCKTETVGVALPKNEVTIDEVGSIIPRDDIFFSVVSRDSVPDPDFRGFAFHFKTGVADPQAKLERIGEVLGTDPGKIENVAMREHESPSVTLGQDKWIEEIDGLVAGTELILTGNYFQGLAIEECVSRSVSEFNRLKARLD